MTIQIFRGQKMYILKDENQIKNAIRRAKQIRPKIKTISFGKYLVTGSKGNLYTVVCRKDERTKNKVIQCSCKAGDKRMPCFHSVVAIAQHLYLAESRQIAKA